MLVKDNFKRLTLNFNPQAFENVSKRQFWQEK